MIKERKEERKLMLYVSGTDLKDNTMLLEVLINNKQVSNLTVIGSLVYLMLGTCIISTKSH